MSSHDTAAPASTPSPIQPASASAAPAGSPAPIPAPRWFIWIACVALAAYAGGLSRYMTAIAGGTDSSGYLNSARLFAEGKFLTELRVPPEFAGLGVERRHFSPAGFDSFPAHSDLAPCYPPGLPLHLSLGALVLGWEAGPFLVQLLAAVAAVWLCYLTARELGVHYSLAAAGAVMLAVFPVFLLTSIQTLSDTLATTWALAAIYCALRGRSSLAWSAACGVALAVAVFVRPTNVLLAPALVLLLGFDLRRLAIFGAAGLPGAVAFGLYNHFLYGGPLNSGYGNIFLDFATRYGVPTAIHFARWLALFLPVVMLVFPFVALVYAGTRRRELIALGLAVAANMGFYLFYSVSHDVWWCLRYILPGVAALILAGLIGVEALAIGPGRRWPRAFRPAMALGLAVWSAGLSWYWSAKLHLSLTPVYEQAYADAARLLRQHAPEHAMVVSCALSGAIYFYTDMSTLLFDSVSPEQFGRYATAARKADRPVYAAIFEMEEEESIRTRCPGEWKKVASIRNIGIWQLQ